jgi:polyhydroxyalkanoate synthesis regulator phasin
MTSRDYLDSESDEKLGYYNTLSRKARNVLTSDQLDEWECLRRKNEELERKRYLETPEGRIEALEERVSDLEDLVRSLVNVKG